LILLWFLRIRRHFRRLLASVCERPAIFRCTSVLRDICFIGFWPVQSISSSLIHHVECGLCSISLAFPTKCPGRLVCITPERAAEILAGIKPHLECDLGNWAVAFGEQSLGLLNPAAYEEIIWRHTGFGFEERKQWSAADAKALHEIGHMERLLQPLKEKMFAASIYCCGRMFSGVVSNLVASRMVGNINGSSLIRAAVDNESSG
jgi:hypothetical protein